MSGDVLSVSSTAQRFLGIHPGLTRRVGYSEENTNSFANSDSTDRADASLGRFRGVYPYSPFYTREPGEFRGLNGQSPLFRTPSGADSPLVRYPAKRSNNALKWQDRSVNVENPREEALNRRSEPYPYDRVFLRPEGKVRSVLLDSRDLNDAYTADKSADVYLLESEIAGYAEDVVVPGVNRHEWSAAPDTARLAIENRGELADRLRDSKDLRSLLKRSPESVLLDESRERVQKQLEEKLRNSSDILDEQFIKDHPRAALNLLARPDMIRWVEEDRDNARSYKSDAGRIDREVEDRLASEAAARVQSLPFNEAFFDVNKGLAEVVWADTLTGHDDAFGTWLEGRSGTLPEDANVRSFAEAYWAGIAQRETGGEGVIPEELFTSESPLAMMTALYSDFAAALEGEAGTISETFADFEPLSITTRARRAYALGLADRTYGDFQRII